MHKRAIFTLLIFFTLLPVIHAQYNACGVDYRSGTEGYGGVTICGIGYACGVSDGVCPQNFSQGVNETSKDFYRYPVIKQPQPTGSDVRVNYTQSFTDGNAACTRLNANCVDVRQGTSETGYSPAPGIDCSTSTSSPAYNASLAYSAQCEAVPRVAGCENCPDPDCMSQVTGYLVDERNDSIRDGGVQLTNDETGQTIITDTNDRGEFTTQGVSGYFNVTCSANFYNATTTEQYISPGKSVAACQPLTGAGCTTNGTAPNKYGEYVCTPSCDGQNGFTSDVFTETGSSRNIVNVCEGRGPDAEIILDRKNETHVWVATCCGSYEAQYQPVAKIADSSGEVDDLEVRNYRKELNGEPVVMRVIVYDEE
jgi:hypothetical protein